VGDDPQEMKKMEKIEAKFGNERPKHSGVAVDYLYVPVTLSDGKEVGYYAETAEIGTVELLRRGLNDAEFEGYCILNVAKYMQRYKNKGGIDDLYKAREYIDFLIRSHCHLPILDDEA
jgi:hypothetical protein